MNKKLLLIGIMLFAGFTKAQTLESHIPKNVGFVLSFDLATLSQKLNFNDLGNYNFMKKSGTADKIMPYDVLKELFRLPEKCALNKASKMYIFNENHDSIDNINYLLSITDVKAFQNRVVDILKTSKYKPEFKKEGKMKVLIYDRVMCIGVGKDYALISIWKPSYYYNDDYYEYNEARNKVIHIIDSINMANQPVDTTSKYEETIIETDTIAPAVVEDAVEETEPEIGMEEGTIAVDSVPYYYDAPVENDYYTNYDNDSLMKQFERSWEVIRKMREDEFYVGKERKMREKQRSIYDLKATNSITSEQEFKTVFSNKGDLIYWFNYKSYSDILIQSVGDRYRYNYDTAYFNQMQRVHHQNTLATIFENNTMYGIGNFNKGEIKMNFISTFNDYLKPYVNDIYKAPINSNFFKYIKSENLMGIMGVSMDFEAIAKLYYDIFRKAIESTPVPNKSVIAAVELTDLFLDKKMLYHTFKGDAVIAVTGIYNQIKNKTFYEYDSLTFESRMVEKTVNSYMPELVFVATIENHENLNRLISMFKKLDGLVEISPNIYTTKVGEKEFDNKFFYIIEGDLFFITNDSVLAMSQIKTGMGSIKTVGESYNTYLNNSSFAFWDASKMFKYMSQNPDGNTQNTNMLLKWSEKVNKGFFVTNPLNGNVANSEITIEMKNLENSSLLELLKLVEDIYLFNK